MVSRVIASMTFTNHSFCYFSTTDHEELVHPDLVSHDTLYGSSFMETGAYTIIINANDDHQES